jgi:SAM-dependent methyltransferase
VTPAADTRLSAEVGAYFDTTAASYDQAYRDRGPAGRVLRRRAAAVLGLLGSVPGDVLDVGMGAGFLCAELDRRGWVVSGVDIAPAMVEGARARLPHRRDSLIQGSIHALPFENERFDAVVATGVLEYAVDDLEGAVHELGRVLEPGGVAVVSYPNHRAPTTVWRGRVVYPLVRAVKRALPSGRPAPPRVTAVPLDRVEQALAAEGMRIEAVVPVGVRPAPARLAARIERDNSRLARALAVQLVLRARKER